MTLGEAPPHAADPLSGTAAVPSAPPKLLGRIETDMFCAQCHYNLHGLDVTLDPRLDIAIVRCPECGKFHPAGIATGAGRIWLRRLSTFLIALWTAFLLGGFATAGILFFTLDMIGFESFMYFEYQNWALPRPAAPGAAPIAPPHTWYWRPATVADFQSWQTFLLAHAFFVAVCILLGYLFGTFLVTCLWHIRRRWHAWTFLFPIAAIFIAYLAYFGDSSRLPRFSPDTPAWAIRMAGWSTTWELIGLTLGILIGRPIARLLLRALLTRRLLQYLPFLWQIDGKAPPALKTAVK